jgi:hypothetical protein
MVRTLAPTHIVESGIFKGLGTWLLERAAPRAELYSIDPDPKSIVYRSTRARYFTRDFSELGLDLPRATTLLFFDDHQNALSRVELAREQRYLHLIFEDNYPAGRGDCYSLKQALMGVAPPAPKGLLERAKNALAGTSPARKDAAGYLASMLDTYFEFPPVRRPPTTRWGDAWTDETYPTPAALLDAAPAPGDPFEADSRDYTWICYARLR